MHGERAAALLRTIKRQVGGFVCQERAFLHQVEDSAGEWVVPGKYLTRHQDEVLWVIGKRNGLTASLLR